MFSFLRRLIQRYGFFKREPKRSMCNGWQQHPFYTDAGQKARRLAAIARERDALKDELAKVIKAKKARAPIYAKLRALSIEELTIEGRRN